MWHLGLCITYMAPREKYNLCDIKLGLGLSITYVGRNIKLS
jgi:hypothetical protein